MLALLCMWLGISTPLIFLGYYFGYRKQVSYQTVGNMCLAKPYQFWLGPLKFTPVKFGGVGYWMVDKPQISYVVDSGTLSFKIKVKIKVKEHLYNFVYHFMDEFATVCTKELCFSLAFYCQNLASLECIFDFYITLRQTLNELEAFYCQWLVLPM